MKTSLRIVLLLVLFLVSNAKGAWLIGNLRDSSETNFPLLSVVITPKSTPQAVGSITIIDIVRNLRVTNGVFGPVWLVGGNYDFDAGVGKHFKITVPPNDTNTYQLNQAAAWATNLSSFGWTNFLGRIDERILKGTGITIVTNNFMQGNESLTISSSGGGGGAAVDDTPFASAWNGVIDVAPSKNTVYDALLAATNDLSGVVTPKITAATNDLNTVLRGALAPQSRALTVNGSTLDLSTDRTFLPITATPQFARIGLGAAADANHLLNFSLGTITTDVRPVNITETRNAAGTTFNGWTYAVTDSASASGSWLMRILGGASGTTLEFGVSKTGNITANGTVNAFNFNASNLSANALIGTDGANTFANYSPGASITVSGGTVNTIQPILTTSTPQFARMGIGGAADATHLVKVTGGTVTSDTHVWDGTQTWNSSGVTFTGFFLNIVNTASAGASKVFDFQVSGVSKASMSTAGTITASAFSGIGSSLTSLNANNLASGTVPAAQMPALTGDVTSSAGTVATTIGAGAVTYAKMQNVSSTARVLGRKTAGPGSTEELTLSDVLDLVGSAAQGDILYRGAATWTRLGAGTSGQFLKTQGAAANPLWATIPGGGDMLAANNLSDVANVATARGNLGLGTASTPQFARLGLGIAADATFEFFLEADNLGVNANHGTYLKNGQAAAAGTQQYSPTVIQEGQGWKTGGTPGSQSVRFARVVVPVQGAANPGGYMIWSNSINGGTWAEIMRLSNAGDLNLSGGLNVVGSATFGGLVSAPNGLSTTAGGIDVNGGAVNLSATGDIIFTGGLSGSGAGLTGLDAGSISGGTLNLARLGTTGTPQFARMGLGVAADATFEFTLEADALGATPNHGIVLQNTTGAAAGAQQWSPAIIQKGKGWKTTATAASQDVAIRTYVEPVQGSANPSAVWHLDLQINGGSWLTGLTVDSSGTVTAGAGLVANNLTDTGLADNAMPKVTAGSKLFTAATPETDYTTPTGTGTMSNKRITARVTTITSSATPTVNSDNADCVNITALAAAITSMTSGLTGTPTEFQQLEYRIKDNGTARAITWGTSFVAGPTALPTTTVISKALHVYFEWDGAQSKWVCMSAGSDA